MTPGAVSLTLCSPFDGVVIPLREVPDPVFAEGMMGDGLAIHPLSDTLMAPCDGVVTTLHAARHAITLRSDAGVDVLVHIGIDTVALKGDGFTAHVHEGQRVTMGQPLITFALDRVALAARSLATPLLVVDGSPCGIIERTMGRVRAGERIMTIEVRPPSDTPRRNDSSNEVQSRTVTIPMRHGIHARPAARIAAALKPFSARVTLHNGARSADGRSTVALLALGTSLGDVVRIEAEGSDAATALDALSDLIASGMGEVDQDDTPVASVEAVAPSSVEPRSGALRGVRASPGLAVGVAYRLETEAPSPEEDGGAIAEERASLADALATTHGHLTSLATLGSGAQRAILGAHLAILEDPTLVESAHRLIDEGLSAGYAWHKVLADQAVKLAELDDPRLRERAADLKDLDRQVRRALAGDLPSGEALPDSAILIADDILPSQLIELDLSRLAGFCTERGGPTSHVAILAAGMGLPSLVAMGADVLEITNGTRLILDADAGFLEIDPPTERVNEIGEAIADRHSRRAIALRDAEMPCVTADGRRIEIFANLGSVADAEQAARHGAEGAGLVRTEFLFLDQQRAPDEEEQRAVYQAIADALVGRPIIVRLLDIGGDKPVPYLTAAREDNPMLGVRGIRLALRYPDLLECQLRAITAVAPAGQLRIMIPMVSTVDEVRQVRAMLERVADMVGMTKPPQLGIMVETPAAAATAGLLAAEADFLSIGTNDLTQYVLAIDRGNAELADRVDPLHPAVLRMIGLTCEGAARHGRPVGVCGGAAGDPAAVPLLIGLGVTELSMVSTLIPETKARVRRLDHAATRALAEAALDCTDARGVRALVRAFEPDMKP